MSLRTLTPPTRYALSTALLLSLAACGGGGSGGGGFLPVASGGTGAATGTAGPTGTTTIPSDTGAGTDTGTPASATLSGIAATGAAFAGAKITVVDQRGVTVCDTVTDAKGAYSCSLPAATKAPLVVIATRDDQTLYSTTASATGGNVNVTPLTTIIVSRLSPNGDPASLAGAIATNPGAVTEATVKAQVAELIAALKPLLTLLGDAVDPITGAFSADGSGHDRLLDSIAVSVHPDGAAANIEITVKSVPDAADGAPLSIIFRSDAALPALPPEVATATLVPTGASLSVAALFARMEQCFALPLAERVGGIVDPNNANARIGGAADVLAVACRTLFVDDNPATFLNNGAKVGRNASNQGAFAGMFRNGATGLKVDRGQLSFFRPNGDMVLTYRTVDTTGGVQNQSIVARNVDGTLKLIGNGYSYSVTVLPTVQDRDFLYAPASSYLNVSYDVNIPSTQSKGGSPLVQALVTAPDKSIYTYKVGSGNANLVVDRPDGSSANTSLLRIAAGYRDAARAGHPSASEPNAFFLPQLSDDDLRKLPEQGVFSVELKFEDGTSVTQTHRMTTRVPTIAEARLRKMADLTPAMRAELLAEVPGPQGMVFDAPQPNEPSVVDFSANGDTDAWTVPAGAPAPVALTIFGKSANNISYEDRADVVSSARKAKVYCSKAGDLDDHCIKPGAFELFNVGTTLTLFQLSATDAQGVLNLKGFATYQPVQ